MYKCFDQVNRELVKEVAHAAGMPDRILIPYMAYLEQMETQFQIGQTIGAPHKDKASIPQGCPFSMSMLALLLKPWINKMRELNVEPRCLADDLMILATGITHQARYIRAMKQSKIYFKDIGARVADNKCFSFAGDSNTRQFLADYIWDDKHTKIPTINNFRDIGTHLNLTNNNNGKTITDRINKARQMAVRLKWLPIDNTFKEKIILANVLPAALYGAEAAHVNKSSMKALRSAIANAIGPRSQRACNDVVFHNVSIANDIDPEVYLLQNRILSLRRLMAKHPKMYETVTDIINIHRNNRQQNINEEIHNGPIGLLIANPKQINAELAPNLVITMPNEAPIDMWNMPWQHLKKRIAQVMDNHRMQRASKERAHLSGMGQADGDITKKIINKLGHKEIKIYKYISSGAAWAQGHMHEIGQADEHCQHCGEKADTISHVTWHCKAINKHRKCRELADINPDALPEYIKHGVPKTMSANINGTFWGETSCTLTDQNKIGLPTKRRKNIAEAQNEEIKFIIKQHGLNEDSDARQIFQSLKAVNGSPHMAMPYKCNVRPPNDINVYTDGSWKNPLMQYLGLGGAGVWWPNRNTAVYHRLNQPEKKFAQHIQYDNGLMLYTSIGGYSGSSTRTELAAAIIAMMANGPVHIGTDSQAFKDKADNILSKLKTGKKIKKTTGELQRTATCGSTLLKQRRPNRPELFESPR